jgi:CBS domain-containing protein
MAWFVVVLFPTLLSVHSFVFICSEMTQRNKPLIMINPEGSLQQAMELLVKYNIHRLPIVHQSERNDVLFIIKHSTLLWDIIASVRSCRTY